MKPKIKGRETKILFFDIESTNLKADFGYIICISWKFFDETKVHSAVISDSPHYKDDPIDDSWILEQFEKAYFQAEIVVAHYGVKFDIRFINTRRLYHHMHPLLGVPIIDTWRVAKDRLALHSNRLSSITDFFNLPQKTALKGGIWLKAMSGHLPSIKYIKQHCEADVLALEASYKKLRPLVLNHPNVNLITGAPYSCPNCGSIKVIKNGWRIAHTQVRQRFACRNCGAISVGKPEKLTSPPEIR